MSGVNSRHLWSTSQTGVRAGLRGKTSIKNGRNFQFHTGGQAGCRKPGKTDNRKGRGGKGRRAGAGSRTDRGCKRNPAHKAGIYG
ncbi:MAG TPA: hypothetical protein DEO89_06855, partial [Lachnospiraceae bacterium]|nr:hypothetical protein [Lachnospiraceae bacterium]